MRIYYLTLLLFCACKIGHASADNSSAPTHQPENSQSLEEDTSKEVEDADETAHLANGEDYGVFGKLSRASRRDSRFTLNATYYSTGFILPLRFGVSGGYVYSPDWTFEPEIFHGSFGISFKGVNFAKFTETYFLLPAKYFPTTNSFYLRLGYGLRRYKVTIGDSLISRISGDKPAHLDLIKVDSHILDLGLGNRWQFENGITLTFDWLEFFVPIGIHDVDAPFLNYVENENDRDNVKTAINIMKAVPTFAVLKLQVGYSF